ncbi:hypothetical protein ABK040_008076 [Willaertia magna]
MFVDENVTNAPLYDGNWLGDFSGPNLTTKHFFDTFRFDNCPILPDYNTNNNNNNILPKKGIPLSSTFIQFASFSTLDVINRSSIQIEYVVDSPNQKSSNHQDWRLGKLIVKNFTLLFGRERIFKHSEFQSFRKSIFDQGVSNDILHYVLEHIFIGELEIHVINQTNSKSKMVKALNHLGLISESNVESDIHNNNGLDGVVVGKHRRVFRLKPICFYFNQNQWSEYIPSFSSSSNVVFTFQANPLMRCDGIFERTAFCNGTSHVFKYESPGKKTGLFLILVILGGITIVFTGIIGIALISFALTWIVCKRSKSQKSTMNTSGNNSNGRHRRNRRNITNGNNNHHSNLQQGNNRIISNMNPNLIDDITDDALSPRDQVSNRSDEDTEDLMNNQLINNNGNNNNSSLMVNPSPIVSTAEAAHLLNITGRRFFRTGRDFN